jgi:hypothetical protein
MLAVLQTARFLSFVFFLLLGIRVSRTKGDGRRRAILLFAIYFLLLSGLSGVTQFDNWPFTTNQLAVTRASSDDRVLTWLELRGVDQHGREWPLDPQSWTPLYYYLVQNFLSVRYPALPHEQQRVAGQFLVARANETRADLAAGRRTGFGRLIGPLDCGYWWRMPRPAAVSPEPFRTIRVYNVDWTFGEIARFHRMVRPRTLLAEIGR